MGWIRSRFFALLLSVASAVGLVQNSSGSTLAEAPNRRDLDAEIAKAKAQLKTYGGGHVVVGRIVLDGPGDPQDVMAQMPILAGGYFAGPTKDLERPIGFRMHLYAPVDFELEGLSGDVVDLGTIHMKPLAPKDLSDLKGKIVLDGGGELNSATLELSVSTAPVNTPSNGYSPRSHWPDHIKAKVQPDGTVSASGFSPIEYYCTVSAPGALTQAFDVTFEPGKPYDLGTITMERPRQISLTYMVAKAQSFDHLRAKTVILTSGDDWKAESGIYGNDLKFQQKQGAVYAHAFYQPCYMADLGEGELQDFVQTAATMELHDQPRDPEIQDGHVYLVHQVTWKHWILFRAEVKEPRAEFRQWTDKSGSFRLDARYIAVKADEVELKKRDGSTVLVPLARLSEADHQYVESITRPSNTTVVPKPPVAGQSARVWYIQTNGPLADAEKVILHWGINGGLKAGEATWQDTVDIPMTASGAGRWYADIAVGAGATTLNFAVNDGNSHWDNNSEKDWNFATAK